MTITFSDVGYSVDISKPLSLAEKLRGLSLRGWPKSETRRKTLLSSINGTILVRAGRVNTVVNAPLAHPCVFWLHSQTL